MTSRRKIEGFNDERLESEMRRILGKSENEELTNDKLAELTEISIIDKSIEDISGIEYCYNLKKLLLSYNQIINISHLSKLQKITKLSWWWNTILLF